MLQLETVFFVGCFVVLFSCLLNYLTWQANKHISSTAILLFYPVTLLAALLCFSLHSLDIPLVSIGIGNTLLFLSTVVMVFALNRMFEIRQTVNIIFITITACLTIIFYWYAFAEPDLYPRTLIFNLQRLLELAILSFIFIKYVRKQFPLASTIYLIHFAIVSAALIARSFALSGMEEAQITVSDWYHLGIFLSVVVSPLFYTIGMAFLCHEKHALNLEELTKEAQQDAELRGLFLSTMSHEIRTPLNGILGSAQLIMSQSISPKNQPYCEAIINSAESLNLLIDKVLDFASLDQSDEGLYEEDIELTPWLDNLCLLLAPLAAQKGIEFKLENNLPDQSCYYFDQQKVRQILINLVGNAIKFTDEGSVTLEIKQNDSSSLNHSINFCIQDTGPGIPQGDIATLTEPYKQSSAGKSKGGTGLGLAITERLLQKLGSTLKITSKLGQGSRFTFDLEMSLGELSLVEQRHESDECLTGLNILLVEDMPLNQKIALEFMAMDDHRVTLAENGNRAIELACESKYDLVLLDMNLPDINGQDVLKHLQTIDHINKTTPFLAFTASLSQEEVKEYVSLGIKDIVGKPIKLDKLRLAIFNSQNSVAALSKTEISDELFDESAAKSLETSFSSDELASVYNDFILTIRGKMARSEELIHTDPEQVIKVFHRQASTALQLGFNRYGMAIKKAERQLLDKDNKVDFEHLKELWQKSLSHYLEHVKSGL